MSQCGPTWGQLETNMGLKIIEKPLFFLGFFNISKKSLEALGNALEDAWGGPGDAWGNLGGTLGDFLRTRGRLEVPAARPWGRLGGLPGNLGTPRGTCWKALGAPRGTNIESTWAK